MENRNSKQGEVICKIPALPLTPNSWQAFCIIMVLMGGVGKRGGQIGWGGGAGGVPKIVIGPFLPIIFQYVERHLPFLFYLIGIGINLKSVNC